jgi:peptidoglycan/LPS O-acetylase OafA/YrhL
MRRFLTLLPLYFVLFFIGNYIVQYIGFHPNSGSDHEISVLRYLTFSFNFNYKETWDSSAAILGNMWSVAALIQILVVWPILMKIFRRNEGIMFILLGITFIAMAWYLKALPVAINKEGMAEYHPFVFNTVNVMFDFMIGSYIAYFSFFKYKTYGFLKKVSKRTIGFLYLGFMAYLIFRIRLLFDFGKEVSPFLLFLADKILVSVFAGFFLFEQNFCSNSVFKLAKIKFLSATEKYMYGMYVMIPFGAYYGYKLISFFKSEETLTLVLLAEPLLGFMITIVLAVLSYEFIEKSFVKMKKEYQPTRDYAPNIANDAKA